MANTTTQSQAQEIILACDLTPAAFDIARWEWVQETDEPERYTDDAWMCITGAIDYIKSHGYDFLEIVSVHGPGTERVFPKSNASVYTGWGAMYEYDRMELVQSGEYAVWRYCDDEGLVTDIVNAWNRHVSRFAYLYRRIEMMGFDYETPGTYALPVSWYEDRYQDELENAIQDVCDILNQYIDDSEEYSYSLQAFDEYLSWQDDEFWFTPDGHLYATRAASYFLDTDGNNLEIVEELSASHMYVTAC